MHILHVHVNLNIMSGEDHIKIYYVDHTITVNSVLPEVLEIGSKEFLVSMEILEIYSGDRSVDLERLGLCPEKFFVFPEILQIW